jgi:ABC-type amino acid transport substrate-binding protein
MKRTLLGALYGTLLCLLALSVRGAEQHRENFPSPRPTEPIPNQKLIVGVAAGPPFNIQKSDGSWTGISIELWRQIAKELGVDFEFRETDLGGNFTPKDGLTLPSAL